LESALATPSAGAEQKPPVVPPAAVDVLNAAREPSTDVIAESSDPVSAGPQLDGEADGEEDGPPAGSAPSRLANGDVVIPLQREKATEQWGVIWDTKALESGQRTVKVCVASSVSGKFNAANPEFAIRPGDRVVSINGAQSSSQKGLELQTVELRRMMIELVLRRP